MYCTSEGTQPTDWYSDYLWLQAMGLNFQFHKLKPEKKKTMLFLTNAQEHNFVLHFLCMVYGPDVFAKWLSISRDADSTHFINWQFS